MQNVIFMFFRIISITSQQIYAVVPNLLKDGYFIFILCNVDDNSNENKTNIYKELSTS